MKAHYPLLLSLSLLLTSSCLSASHHDDVSFSRARNKIETIVSTNNTFVDSNTRATFEDYLKTQTPALTILMCSDSRVQPSSMNDTPKGELFTIRNIGNQVPLNEGSIDYGVLVLKTPLLMILGHTGCGAVKAVFEGNIDVPQSILHELSSVTVGNAKSEKAATINNIDHQVKIALEKYQKIVSNKNLYIIGAIYDLHNLFGFGHGTLVITNINGATKPAAIKKHPLLKSIRNIKIAR